MVYNKRMNNGRLANGNVADLIADIRQMLTKIELAEITVDHGDYFNGTMIRLKRAKAEANLALNYVNYIVE
jgi:hypothetical protein